MVIIPSNQLQHLVCDQLCYVISLFLLFQNHISVTNHIVPFQSLCISANISERYSFHKDSVMCIKMKEKPNVKL